MFTHVWNRYSILACYTVKNIWSCNWIQVHTQRERKQRKYPKAKHVWKQVMRILTEPEAFEVLATALLLITRTFWCCFYKLLLWYFPTSLLYILVYPTTICLSIDCELCRAEHLTMCLFNNEDPNLRWSLQSLLEDSNNDFAFISETHVVAIVQDFCFFAEGNVPLWDNFLSFHALFPDFPSATQHFSHIVSVVAVYWDLVLLNHSPQYQLKFIAIFVNRILVQEASGWLITSTWHIFRAIQN